MNDVLARAACDFEDDTPHRQDIAKDIENEIAITYCCRRVLAMIGHLPRTFDTTWLELCLRHARQSASRRVRICSLQRFLVIRFDASTAWPLLCRCCHWRNHATPVTRQQS